MEDSVNQNLFDATLRHEVRLIKLQNSEVRAVFELLQVAETDLVAQLRKRDVAGDNASFTRSRLEALLQSIREILDNAYVEIERRMKGTLADVAEHEANWAVRTLEKSIPVKFDLVTPNVAQLRAAVSEVPFDGSVLSEWRENLSRGAYNRIKEAVRVGFVTGETNDQIVRRIAGTRANKYRDGLLNINRKSAESFVRTATSAIANYARHGTFKENSDILKSYIWTSSLDNRTCSSCGALDGKLFPIDSEKKPPLHRSCRCTLVAQVKSYRELGIDLDEAAPGTRASMNGQVPASEKFGTWIKKQPVDVQEDVLGKTKAKLLRDGKLDIEDFVNHRGMELTLDQLRAVEGAAFKRAGIK